MRTLEEAIKFSEKVAEELNEKACDLYENEDYENAKDCIWGAKEHRQLAEWLKKLQAYEEAREEIIRKRDSGQWSEAVVFGLNHAIYIIDKHLREVKADEGNSN